MPDEICIAVYKRRKRVYVADQKEGLMIFFRGGPKDLKVAAGGLDFDWTSTELYTCITAYRWRLQNYIIPSLWASNRVLRRMTRVFDGNEASSRAF